MKPRIAYLGIKGLPSKSGTERVIEAIAARLCNDFDITIYCDADYTPANTFYENIHLVRIRTFKGKHFKPISLDILSSLHALFFGDYDLIHMNGVDNCFILPFLKLRYHIISTSHGNPGRLPMNKWNALDRLTMKLLEYPFLYISDLSTVISPMDQEDFEKRYNKKVVYIPNGVDMDVQVDRSGAQKLIEKLGLAPDGFLLFIAGRVIERKGCHLLLEAARKSKLGLPILVIGDLEQDPTYSRKLKELAAGQNVVFLTPVEDKSLLWGILAICRLFIFPSTSEGMSMMLLEAASTGAPMICSDIPENRAVLEDHVTYFHSGDPADLTEKISWALNHRAELDLLAETLKDTVAKEYSWDEIALQYKKLYHDNIPGKGIRRSP